MMICCSLCGKKYINTDGTIDQKRIKKLLKDKYGKDYNAEGKLCMSECHKDGKYVMC
jgi:hypothetical protein